MYNKIMVFGREKYRSPEEVLTGRGEMCDFQQNC